MSGSLLDTNVIIKCARGDIDAEELLQRLGSNLFIPVTVAGELFFGAYKSQRAAENLAVFRGFIASYSLLPIDERVSDMYGKTKANISAKGINIPENDVWIAAVALTYQLPLATFDAHFSHIDGLTIVS